MLVVKQNRREIYERKMNAPLSPYSILFWGYSSPTSTPINSGEHFISGFLMTILIYNLYLVSDSGSHAYMYT